MPIDSKKIDALLDAIKKTLNPPVPVAMTMEEFLKYAGEQLSKLANEDGEIAKQRVLSLNTAFEAMKAAGEAKLEKGDVIVFEEPAPPAAAPVTEPETPVAEVAAPAETPAAPVTEPEVMKAAKFVWPADMSAKHPKPADKT